MLKLGAGFLIIVGTVTAPIDWTGWYFAVLIILAAGIVLSRIAPLFLIRRLVILSPFVLGVAVVNAFQPSEGVGWLSVTIKSALCLLTVVLISNTTPFNQLLKVLRTVHVPGLLITTMALMHRYLFVLADEGERMRRARLGRTFTRGRRFKWGSLASVVGQLFVRTSERAERIYDAMCARGWK
jgi:cobalt/nickel transport system permease protein